MTTAPQQSTRIVVHNRILYRVASTLCLVALAFSLVMGILLTANYVRFKTADPLNDPALVALRERFSGDTGNAALKEDIRALDLLVRQAFFTSQAQIHTGGILLLIAVLLLVVLLNIIDSVREKLPDPTGCPGLDSVWGAVFAGRKAVTLTGAALLVGAVAAGLASHSLLSDVAALPRAAAPTPDNAAPTNAPSAATDAAAPVAMTPAGLPDAPDALRSVSFRGAHGSGYSQHKDVPTHWDETTGEGIVWKADVPLSGLSSPIVWGEHIFLTGATRARRELYCYRAIDGALLWTGTYAGATNATTQYDVYDLPEALMFAVPTPATDGRRVYTLYANGELVAFDAGTGEALWSRLLGDPRDNTYGLSGSLIPFGTNVIAQFDGDRNTLACYAGATGQELWLSDRPDTTWASPILVPLATNRQAVITHGAPATTAWDPISGAQLWSADLCSGDVAPSPIYADGKVLVNFTGCGIYAVDVNSGARLWSCEELETGDFSDAVSMVSDGEFVYQINSDVLSVLAVGDGSIAYEQTLAHPASYASPFIVGKHLYLVCGAHVLVAATGPAFVAEADNELSESCNSSPAVVQGRIYMRTDTRLYCLGAK